MPVKQRKIVRVRGVLWCLTGLAIATSVMRVEAQTPVLTVPLFRLFLVDGTEVSTYGEFTRVEGDVVATIPVGDVPGAATGHATTQTVTIAAGRVDWPRTDAYSRAVRLAQYTASTAERDYQAFTEDVARTLDQVSSTPDPLAKISIVESARMRLADWPRDHYGYRQQEAEATLTVLDDVLAGLRASAGQRHFSLTLATDGRPATVPPPLRPVPTLRDVVAQALGLAKHLGDPAERMRLLTRVLATLERGGTWSRTWERQTRREARRLLDDERKTTRAYAALRERIVTRADDYVAKADVRSLLALREDVVVRDERLGRRRPAEMMALLAHLDAELDQARAFRLALDRWEQQRPALEAYTRGVSAGLERSSLVIDALDDIRTLAGPPLHELDRAEAALAGLQVQVGSLQPPGPAAEVHALLTSALQMTASAARSRRMATLSGDLPKAWDASAAAAGALMMFERIRATLVQLVQAPEPGAPGVGSRRR